MLAAFISVFLKQSLLVQKQEINKAVFADEAWTQYQQKSTGWCEEGETKVVPKKVSMTGIAVFMYSDGASTDTSMSFHK